MGVNSEAFMYEVAARPKWLALSTTPDGAPIREPNLEDGYVRVPLVESDWHTGRVEVKFGPAKSRWEIASMVLMSATGASIDRENVSFTVEPGWTAELDYTGLVG